MARPRHPHGIYGMVAAPRKSIPGILFLGKRFSGAVDVLWLFFDAVRMCRGRAVEDFGTAIPWRYRRGHRELCDPGIMRPNA